MKTSSFAVGATVAAAGLLISACTAWKLFSGDVPAPSPTPASPVSRPQAPVGDPARADSFPTTSMLPGLHECLTTQDGWRRKVVTREAGLRCVDAVEDGRLTGDELPLFQELFVLDAVPTPEEPEWYLVSKSPRKAHRQGYLRSGSVVEWNSRLGLRPVADVLFYGGRSPAEELAKTGRSLGQPIGRAAPDTERRYLPWPIVASYTVTNERGQIVEVALLNFIGERRVGDDVGDPATDRAGYSDVRKQQITRAISIICLAFCVDNTNSTDQFVPEIVDFIVDTSNIVSEKRPQLRLALTLYRDDVPGLTWAGSVTKTLWDGEPQPIGTFLPAVRPIKAPTTSSVDWPECAYQGLLETLQTTEWEKLSHKVIVWISDNSAHPKGSEKNPSVGPEEIIRLANAKGVTIHAVAIRGGGGDAEQSQHSDQCRRITEATGGQCCGLDDAHVLAAEIAKVVDREHAVVRANRDELQKIARGEMTVQQYMAATDGGDLRRRYRFVRLLSSAGVDLEKFVPNQPTFAQGWVPIQLPGGRPLFERMVYVSRVELDVLLSELNHLVALLRQDSTQGVLDTFASALGARVGDQSFFSIKREGDIPFDVFMAARGIPMRTGISMKTRDEILAMSAEEKLLLKASLVNDVIPNLTNARSSTAFTLTGDFDFGWIPEDTLP